jgi:hypothetical protein
MRPSWQFFANGSFLLPFLLPFCFADQAHGRQIIQNLPDGFLRYGYSRLISHHRELTRSVYIGGIYASTIQSHGEER